MCELYISIYKSCTLRDKIVLKKMVKYITKQGDIKVLSFDSQIGYNQR